MGIKIPHIEHVTVGEIAENFARVRATDKDDAYQLAKGNGGSGVKGTGKGKDVNTGSNSSKLVGREVNLDWLGDKYKAVELEGSVKVGGKEMDVSRRVYQRTDIQWDYKPMHPKAKGLSNRELAAKGRPPFVVDKNGVETQIELHHLLQKEPGDMVEIFATTHDEYKKILHGLIKDGDSFRNSDILDKQYNNFRKKYWKWRFNNLD
ncbi:HNH/ENDO VII family nuclease [Bacillus cytotoxicus]|nr:HNH/ENDO VII family nuclease [Bacillus cytotoxicus]